MNADLTNQLQADMPPLTKLLIIETTGPMASVALIDENRHIVERLNDTRYSHLEELAPMIGALMSEHGVEAESIDAVAVSRGPGSFTGNRIGLVTAKALALVWQKPIVEVPSLESFAYHEAFRPGALVVPVLDARRSQIYAGAYRKTEVHEVTEVIGEGAHDPEAFLDLLASRQQEGEVAQFCGDGAGVYAQVLERYAKPFVFVEGAGEVQQAQAAAQLALNLWRSGKAVDAAAASPEYLRVSEAERKRNERCRK